MHWPPSESSLVHEEARHTLAGRHGNFFSMASVQKAIRMGRYSIRTKQLHRFWIQRFISFHGCRHPRELAKGDVADLPTDLLQAEDVGENERRDDRRVRLDDELGRLNRELAPGDLLVRHRARVRAVARR